MHTIKPQWKRAAVPAAVALVLGAAMAAGTAQAARVIIGPEQVYRSSNFTMLSSGGGQVGGTNDVKGFWDGTAYNSQSDIPADLTTGSPNAVIQSPTKFFGFVWTAATVMVFAPGTYTFTEDKNTSTATWDAGGTSHTMTVGAGQLGAHMLFNWSSSHNIGVVDVWDKNAKFAPSALWTGALVTADSWSGKSTTAWTLMSGLAADDPAHPNINGQPMINGPFNGFNANFNLYAVDTGPTAKDDSCAAAPAPASTVCNVVANDVAQSGSIDPATVVVESNPSRGTAVANANGTVTYTPASGVTAGTDSFTYTVRDNSTVGYDETTLIPDSKGLRSNLATVLVNIGAPSAGADSAQTPQGSTGVVVDVLANDSAPAGATLNAASVTVTTPPGVGATSVNSTNGKITYTPPNKSFTGVVKFQYTVADSNTRVSSPAWVTVHIQGTGIGSSTGAESAGSLAASQGLASGRMTPANLAEAGVPKDPGAVTECVGGCFDFNLSNVTAPTARVVLKLSASIPTNPGYRKWNGNKWADFAATAPNALFSAPLAGSGNCPAAGDIAYTTGLQTGNRCVELVIQDNGPNDQDKTTGAIADPGGVAQLPIAGAAVQVTPTPPGIGGGCTLAANGSPWRGGAWWLTGGLLGWLGFSRRRRASRPS